MNKANKKQNGSSDYTLEQYKQHYQELLQYSNIIDNKSKQLICEKVELICEFSIWGDQNNSDFFDYFFEENIADKLLKIMIRSSFKEIIIGIIQSFAILLANLTNKENVNYLLSHPVIQDLIMYNYDFTDEEIVDYYISLLKSLALRIDEDNVQLFFNQRMSLFPLLWQATKFYNHKEIMVRTAVRTIILGIMKIQNPVLKKYLTRFPFILFFVHFSCYLKHVWLEANKEVLEGNVDVKEKMDDLVDVFYFLNDIYAFCPEISHILDNSLLTYTIIPAMLGGILFQKKETLSISFTLHLTNHLINNFNTTNLSKNIILLLFSPSLQKKLCHLLEFNIGQPRSYLYSWSFRNFWDQHQDVLVSQANQLFDIQSYALKEEACDKEIETINKALGITDNDHVLFYCKQLLLNNGQEEMSPNKIRTNLMIYLQTKDDNLLFLLLNLIKSVLLFKEKDILRICLFQEANTNIIMKERNQIIYQLLDIFLIDPSLRLCTIILTCQIIIHFINLDKLILERETINKLYEVYHYTIIKMNQMIKQNQYHEVIVSQYEIIYNKYNQNLKILKPNLDYLAFSPIIDKHDANVDLMYRQPVGLKEVAIKDLAIFFMIDLVFFQIISQEKINQNRNLQVLQKINITNSWIIGQNYEPPDGCQLLSCRISAKTIKDKLQPCTSGECFWMEDDENFIIMETQIVKKEWAHIIYHAKIKDVEVMIDRGEPRKLNVNIKISSSNSIKEQYQDVQLLFDDCTYAQKTKKHIDDTRRSNSKKSSQIIENRLTQGLQVCNEYFKSIKQQEQSQ
ncbi:unnamed protein product [Paramecium primaurelia]|uniref:FPL domain-containing protein n=1 Tax=Paramecium primaurelia TaxID=5886 RepID=A0A8S1Q9F3_PARPR|nr:unnamed protein product [Paramecium primaurelia]